MTYFYEYVDNQNMNKWVCTEQYNKQDLQDEKNLNANIKGLSSDEKKIILKGNIDIRDSSQLDDKLNKRDTDIDTIIDLMNNSTEVITFDKIIE